MPPRKSSPFADLKPKDEFYSSDQPWMQRAVLVAKHVPIWMTQCERNYGLPIKHISDIPDEELQKLADLGYTVIWLVGLWRRSRISKAIKRQIGLTQSEASAYSVLAYVVAHEWGGEPALAEFRRRAARFGLRLGADMVPNHTAIDAQWMSTHPDFYLSTESSPIPQYSFTGPDLSSDAGQEIYLEDHYLDQSDAAVVFKRVETETGATQFVYHGNDGVLTPWNDTAQLDFTNPELRKALIAELVRLAQQFSLLRLDAAMLLTNQHIQRLWHPARGERSHIPTRATFRRSKAEFARQFPREFWREAVQVLRVEAPDTLLLAEAYWMLENYFAHSLGLHRVYNIQFMRSLGPGKNEEFRATLTELMDFDPRLLNRRANFLSNPDEESTAYAFGTAERYFCLCTLLATLPGLPIFAHGQAEGYAERYAMDVLQPYLDESPDLGLLNEHIRRIAPLLRRRDLFADAQHFQLLELRDRQGRLFEDVICFLNRSANESALVLANNSKRKVASGLLVLPLQKEGKKRRKKLSSLLGLDKGQSWQAKTFPSGEEISLNTTELDYGQSAFTLAPYETRVIWEFTRPS